MNAEGTQTFYDDPKVVEALQFWVDLSQKHNIHAPGIVEWGTTPKDFFEGKTAIMWTTTGNPTNVRKTAKFPFGAAMLPEKERHRHPHARGQFSLHKKERPQRKKG